MDIFQRIIGRIMNRRVNGGTLGAGVPGSVDVPNAAKDLGENTVFANAVKDIEADIAQQNKSQAAHQAAANADQDAAEANQRAAEKLEGDAGGLEQPVNAGNNKARNIVFSGIGAVIVIGLIAGFGIRFGNNPADKPTAKAEIPAPSTQPAPTPPALRAGLTMAWVDGSTLIFVPDPNGGDDKKGFWITTNPISNYQFSLCVQSGQCKPPTIPYSSKDYNDPSKQGQPFSIAGADDSTEYCAWVNGHVPNDPELAGFTDELRNAGFTDELRVGFHCIVDNPRPMALYCQTSAYHDPSQPIEDPSHVLVPKGSFCENGKSYLTLDMTMDAKDTLQSVNPQGKGENCQVLNGSRIVCGGVPLSSTTITIGLVSDSVTGFTCQAGSDLSAAGCTTNVKGGLIAGMDDWELTAGGAPLPRSGVQFTPNFVFVNGVMVAQSLSVNALSENGLSTNSLAVNNMAINGLQFNGIAHPVCPVGYYFDDKTKTCVAPAPPTDATCLSGYSLDQSNLCCAASAPNGRYPGCPTGQILNPLTGMCDPRRTLISATSSLDTQAFDVTFPVCAAPPTPTPQKSGNSVSCGSITSDSVCNSTPGCSFDYVGKICK
jgi:hypothetical protein